MDILQLQEMANGMPTPALLEAVNSPNSPIPPFLALTVLSERKKASLANNAQKAQAEMAGKPPTVAQEVAQGVAGLPTGNAIPQQYAAGGVVAFAGGGGTSGDQFGMEFNGPYWMEQPSSNPFDLQRNMAVRQIERYKQAGRLAEAQALERDLLARTAGQQQNAVQPQALSGNDAEFVPGYPTQATQSRGTSGIPSLATPGIAPPGTNRASAGVASVIGGRSGAGLGFPEFVDPTQGAQPRVTEEQRMQMYKDKYEQIKAIFGPDAAEQYLKEIQGEREALKKRYEENKDEAWLRAGLGMLAGRSKYGAINIGEGGQQGLNAYQAGRASLDNQARDLRREQMQAAMQMQARQDQMRGLGIQQGEAAAGRQDQVRQEQIKVNEARLQHKIGEAEFGLGVRKLDIELMKAKAEMARAVQAGELTKQDAAARIYQQAQQEALKYIQSQVEAAEKNPMGGKSEYAKMSEAERFAASQIIARRWIENNDPLGNITARGAVPAAPVNRTWPGSK